MMNYERIISTHTPHVGCDDIAWQPLPEPPKGDE